jgi:hypothetical protein
MTGIQIKTGSNETAVPAGRFVWRKRTEHAHAMMTEHPLARISLSHQHGLALPHQTAVAHIAAAQETAVTDHGTKPAGKKSKRSIRGDPHGLIHLATIESCRTLEAPHGTDGMHGRMKMSTLVRLPAAADQRSSGRIVAVNSETGAHGMTSRPGSITRRKVPGYQPGNAIKSLLRTGLTLTGLAGVDGREGIRKTHGNPAGVVCPTPVAWHRQATNGL